MFTKRYTNPLGDGFYTVELKLLRSAGGRYRYRIALITPASVRLFGKEHDVMSVPSNSLGRAFNDALCFMTLQPGDTDKEFFDDYTDIERTWAASYDCEALSCEVVP